MKRVVEIRVINPKREGTSPSTGQPWRVQDIVVAWTENEEDGTSVENVMNITLKGVQQEMFEHCDYKVKDQLEMEFQFYTFMKGSYVNNGVNAKICKD